MSKGNTYFRKFWEREGGNCLPRLSILAVGDIMLSRGVGKKIAKHGPEYPFLRIAPVLAQEQVVFGNLECPISSRGTRTPFVQSNFRADPAVIKGLAVAGFKILSLANNHFYDYGEEAVEDTLRLLNAAGIRVVGVGRSSEEARKPVIIVANDLKVGFLAYTSAYNAVNLRHKYVAAPINLQWIKKDIQQLKQQADVCIVSLHFGYEGVEYPPPECRRQARKIIELGADLVLGHHPHVIQGMEAYKKGFIAYSLGDFVFDNLTDIRRQSVVLKASFTKDGLQRVDLLPIWINDEYQPEIAEGRIGDDILNRINSLSQYLRDGSSDKRFWEVAGRKFLSDQKMGLIRSIRQDGLKAVFARIKHLRWFHLKLLWASLIVRIKGVRRR